MSVLQRSKFMIIGIIVSFILPSFASRPVRGQNVLSHNKQHYYHSLV